MPCDTVITVALVTYDVATLCAALAALGLEPRRQGLEVRFRGGEYVNGKLRLVGSSTSQAEALQGRIRQGYTRETLMAAARRQGLRVQVDAKDPAVFRLTTDGRVL